MLLRGGSVLSKFLRKPTQHFRWLLRRKCAPGSPLQSRSSSTADEQSLGDTTTTRFDPEQMRPKPKPGMYTVMVPGASVRFHSGVVGKLLKYIGSTIVDVSFDFRSWAIHTGPFRHFKLWVVPKHFSDMRRIWFPDVAFVTLIASAVTYYNHLVAEKVQKMLDVNQDGHISTAELNAGMEAGLIEARHMMGTDFFITSDMLQLATTPFTLTSITLGMMLTFRTQNCNARYEEARRLWGSLINESRALGARILALVPPKDRETPAHRATVHALKCIMTFSHTLKFHLTVCGHCPALQPLIDSGGDVDALNNAALRQELETIWDVNNPQERAFMDRLFHAEVNHRPLHVLQELAEINGQIFAAPTSEGGAGLHAVETDRIYQSLTRFHDVLGACERIYKTPIFTGYTKFTSRGVWFWTCMLPLCLYPIMGPIATIPTSTVVAMFMFGLENVGDAIEEPFGSLPLWQFCDGIDAVTRQALTQHGVLQHTVR